MRIGMGIWLASVLLFALAGAAASDPVDARIKLFRFQPGMLEVRAGTEVRWTNDDAIEHSVTGGEPESESGAFDSGFFNKGQTWSHGFDMPGTYPYFCRRHPSMRGLVTVVP
jgi:plastocyanin